MVENAAHQIKKPTIAKAMVGGVGKTGQVSNLIIKDLEKIKDFLEHNKTLLDFFDEPF
jgi:hypothetical protein